VTELPEIMINYRDGYRGYIVEQNGQLELTDRRCRWRSDRSIACLDRRDATYETRSCTWW